MSELLSNKAVFFTLAAVLGTALFLLRIAMMLLGGGDVDFHHDVSTDNFADAHHGDPSDSFKLISIQSVAAFLMGFGWAALGSLLGQGWNPLVSALVGVVGGVAIVWLLGLSLKAVYDLQTSGNVDTEQAVGCEGTVYVGIPAQGEGRGQVLVVVDDRQRTYDAISIGPPILSQARVRVIAVSDSNTLAVAPV